MRLAPAHARRSALQGALAMTSMIDVVFLLLIFFLVTSAYSMEEGRLAAAARPPREGPATSELAPQVVEVRLVNARDTFVLGDRATTSAEQLTQWLAALPREQGVAIRVSDDVSVASAARALQAAQDAGFTKKNYVPSAE